MRLLHAATALAATSALALTLSACGSGSGSGSGGASGGGQSSAPASSPSATASSDAPADEAGATKDAGSSTATGGANTDTGASRCHTGGLGFSFGSGDGKVSSSDDQQQLVVVLKNKTSAACTVQGFPGVDLKSSKGSWSLTRTSATPKKVTLAAGTSTTFTLTFLPWTQDSGTEFKATSVVITPPNETTSATLTWPGGSVLLQDGATHPGSYTGPVGG
ncbi:DUF4232 domain-containing protein [Streptomyces sp. NPDC058252]|uniref:DUF4232 domain-containing protein n=1 Tax=Streptomyces sp. NPDC058252 TaxID=3346405 RepID=UPI0036EF628A